MAKHKQICPTCGSEFITYHHNFCSKSCFYNYTRKHAKYGKDHFNYKKIKVMCSFCEKMIYKSPCRIKYKTQFCNRDCHTNYQKINKKEHERMKKIGIQKNNEPWNKGKDIRKEYYCLVCNEKFKSYTLSKFCSRKCFFKFNKGPNNGMWNGGISRYYKLGYWSNDYKKWRKSVFKRDNYTCQNPSCHYCYNRKGSKLNAHHIKSFTYHPESRFDVNNGITLCQGYHYNFDPNRGIRK